MRPTHVHHLFVSPENMAACVDLYELTMAAGYFTQRPDAVATFELSIRKLPRRRAYLVAAGLEQALSFLQDVRFDRETIRWLRAHPALTRVPDEFFTYLANFRFSGDVMAVPEGTVVFAGEPLLYVRAPIIEAQIVETFLLCTINFQTAVASKAARVVTAAQGRPVADFGSRRAHGPQAAVLAARAAYIGGCVATSNVLAGRLLGMPVTGTLAHSWIMAFGDEGEAFRKYAEVFPDSTVLLIDTYDTIEGARRAAQLGRIVKAVRIDSGDIATLSRRVREILDRAGLQNTKIIASGDLNEYRIARILRQKAPVDMFGVGTEMVTSRDDPAMPGVYKLVKVEREGRVLPALKLSREKTSLPYVKQIRRISGTSGVFRRDVVGLWEERGRGEPLLVPVMKAGRICRPLPALAEVQARCREQLQRLPASLRCLTARASYPVCNSRELVKVARAAMEGRE